MGQLEHAVDCFRAAGSQYHGTPAASGGRSGPVFATTRVVAGVDLRTSLPALGLGFGALRLGGRVGTVIRGLGPLADGADAPRPLPWTIEARVGFEPLSRPDLRLVTWAALGIAQTDAHVRVGIVEDRSVNPPRYQLDNPDRQTVDAYRRYGKAYFGVGAGIALRIASSLFLRIDLSARTTFPSGGFVFVPSIGAEVEL